MAQLDIDKLVARAEKGFTERDINRQMFEDCYEYMLPYRNTFNKDGDQSHNRPTVQYDSTAMHAAANFVNTMQGNFTPVFTRWAELKAGPGVPEKQRKRYNKDLEKLTDVIFTYLNASNFATASAEAFFEWGIGTAALWLHEGDQQQPLNFMATPMSEMGLVEGRFGTVDGRFRKYKVKARLIKATWPNDKVDLGSDLADLVRNNPDEDVELIEACYYDYDDFVWRYEVIYEKSKHRLLAKTFNEEICFTPRWLKIPGHAFGIGPFILAMADVKTLNKMKEYMLRNAALSVFGVYTVASNGGFNPNMAKIQPNAFIPVERNGGPSGPTIQALERTGSFDVQEFMIQDLQDSIRKTMLDTRLPDQQPTPATAFEIAERIKEFQQDIGSAYGRAMFEFVQPLFKRIIAILSRKGLIELPEGFEIDNFFVQVQVVSPIAQTQALEDVQKFMQTFQMTAGINPQLALMAYEVEKVPGWLTEKTGSPAALLRDIPPEEIKQALLAFAQAQLQGGTPPQDVGAPQ
ncbi:MAG: portal protein [Candidatus Puniceispirillaceae bacterium]